MPGLATICVLFSHKANGEKAHKYRLCRHLPSYIGLGLKIVSRLKEKANNNCNIYLHSYNSSLDKSIIKDLDIRILPIKRKKLNYLLWKINVFLKEHKSNYQISSENYIEKKDSVFLSIGGDIYTIPEKFWNDENYLA